MTRFVMICLSALIAACAMAPDLDKLTNDCLTKYRVDMPSGATVAKADPPLRITRVPRGGGYACVTVFITEAGTVTDSSLLEADPPEFGEYFLKLAAQSRYRPAMLDGKPIARKAIITAKVQ